MRFLSNIFTVLGAILIGIFLLGVLAFAIAAVIHLIILGGWATVGGIALACLLVGALLIVIAMLLGD